MTCPLTGRLGHLDVGLAKVAEVDRRRGGGHAPAGAHARSRGLQHHAGAA